MSINTKPVYLIAGGPGSRRKGPDPLLLAVFKGFGIKDAAVAYTGTASDDDKDFFSWISSSFVAAGAGSVTHAVIAPKRADLNKAKEILSSADIIFVSGGDVELGMKILQDKDMLDFMNGLYKQDKPFFGISAGAIMLGKEWVRWTDPDDDDSAELFPCLGYAPVACDTHDEDTDWEELKAYLKLKNDGDIGYGLSSGAGIKVMPDGKVEPMGGKNLLYAKRGGKVVKVKEF
jgi:cyanophycinase-like exopeptidase